MVFDDARDAAGLWIRYVTLNNGSLHYSVSGSKWNNLEARCLVGGNIQSRQPSYVGCTNRFECYQHFAEWANSQVGFCKEYHLDKDILCKGNKEYSPETCVFVPESSNKFLNLRQNHRGSYPLGVYFVKRRGLFASRCMFDGKCHHLGLFQSPEEAHYAYRDFKEEKANVLAERWVGYVDERVVQALKNYKVCMQD